MKILIAGGGIGGLTTALCLQKAGHEVRVFEQAPAFVEVGAGLQCGANVVAVLDYLGLREAAQACAVAPERAEFRDAFSGEVLYSAQFGQEYQAKYGAPYLHVHRADLQRILAQAVMANDPQSIELNAPVTRFTETPDSVQLSLPEGRHVEGDCLIGADGIKSQVRAQLFGNASTNTSARFTGNVAWRGVVPVERLPADFMQTVVSNFVGPHKHMVIYYVRNKQLVNFVGVVESKQPQGDSWVQQAPWQELKDAFSGWHSTVQTVIDAMDKEACYRWDLYDHQPFDHWSSRRVTLLGDAAHATLPFMASGAAMAIEDARVLQRALDQQLGATDNPADGIAQGLQCYQRNRLVRTAKVQRDSVRFGKLYHLPNRLALKLAFKALRPIAQRKEAFLPSYNANTVLLM